MEQLFSYIEELELKVCIKISMLAPWLNSSQLYEAELRCAMIESETREEVAQEMEARMEKMEKMHSQRVLREVSSLP